MTELRDQFGDMDIYLFDQLLRGRITPGMRVLDAGCGYGRNLVYLTRQGYDVYGVDSDAGAIQEAMRDLGLGTDRLRVAHCESLPFPDDWAHVVISSAVLHFASGEEQFQAMLRDLWRVLRPGGMLFCRLASSIGIAAQIRRLEGRRFLLPDGSARYLVDAPMLLNLAREMRGELLDPIKTTIVDNQRSMTTWVVRKTFPGRG